MKLSLPEKSRLGRQSQQVLERMLDGGWVDQVQARDWEPEVMALKSRISDIKSAGYRIESRVKDGKRYYQYRLREDKPVGLLF